MLLVYINNTKLIKPKLMSFENYLPRQSSLHVDGIKVVGFS